MWCPSHQPPQRSKLAVRSSWCHLLQPWQLVSHPPRYLCWQWLPSESGDREKGKRCFGLDLQPNSALLQVQIVNLSPALGRVDGHESMFFAIRLQWRTQEWHNYPCYLLRCRTLPALHAHVVE